MPARFNHRWLLWPLLALPAALILQQLGYGTLPMKLYASSGEWSLRLIILALLPGPLAEFFGRTAFLRGWLKIRRNLGVAAFAYGALHLLIYVLDMQQLSAILDELTLPAIWTGWLALFALLIPAAISFDAAMRALRRRWQQLQYLVYPACLLALAHWLLLAWNWLPIVLHAGPLAVAWALRALARSHIHLRSTAP